MNVQKLRQYGINKLEEYKIEDGITKADILLQYTLNLSKVELRLSDREVNKEKEDEYIKYINEVIMGKPVQYITHFQEFMNLKFYVDENVLIPQPDTEILVEKALEIIRLDIEEKNIRKKIDKKQIKHNEKIINNSKYRILDLCTGSGIIAISIENYINNLLKTKLLETNDLVEIYASDISRKAIEIARKNAFNNNKNSKINYILSDMFKNINIKDFDLIVTNPPYIETKTIFELSKEVQNEPHIALDGGEDGLYFYKIIAKEVKKIIKDKGFILLEIGYNQKEKIIDLFKKENYKYIECIKDLEGNDRVIIIKID